MITAFRRRIAILLVISICGLGLPLPGKAGMVATDADASEAEGARVVSLLERAEVRTQLEAYGVSTVDAKARVAALSDEEAAQLAAHIDSLPAGGVLGAIVFVFLVLLLTDILGLTKVFPFTTSVR